MKKQNQKTQQKNKQTKTKTNKKPTKENKLSNKKPPKLRNAALPSITNHQIFCSSRGLSGMEAEGVEEVKN